MNTNVYPVVDPHSSTTVPSSPTPGPPLQRGKACLSCRRRKLKCDGARPVCTPCLRGDRTEDCEYTDGPHRSRMLTLEEDIARLRARIQELENPVGATPSVELHAPYVGTSAGASRAMGESASVSLAPVQAPSYHQMRQVTSPRPPRSGTTEPRQVDLDEEIHLHARRALSAIAPHAAELGFFLNPDRLRAQGTHVSPALQSALTLWSVHIASTSEPDHPQTRERTKILTSTLLSRAQTQLASALGTVDVEPDPGITLHVIQTGVLLAYYMQRLGQVVGARYYASGTWALAIMLKLYRHPRLSTGTREGDGQTPRGDRAREGLAPGGFAGCARLAPALDGIEAEERVRAFWAVFALDRWFSVAYDGPCQSLAVGGSSRNAMTVHWPGVGGTAKSNVIQDFLNDRSHDFTQQGPSAIQAKASVLLNEAVDISASFVADHAVSQSAAFRARFGALDVLLQRCLSAAITMANVSHGRQPHTQEQAQALLTVHLVVLAQVALHRPLIPTYEPSRRRCVEGALGIVRMLDQRGESGMGTGAISPIYAVVWTALCLAVHEVLRLRARSDADPSRRREESDVTGAIRKLAYLLSALSQRCPSPFFAANIEAVLPVLESITV